MTSCPTAGRERERTKAKRRRGERRSPNMGASAKKRMVADGQIVVLSSKNVVISWFFTWWEGGNWCRFGRFLNTKNIDAWRCTRSRADGCVKVVKCYGMREEDACGSILFTWGFTG
jgi:hypothetical protein